MITAAAADDVARARFGVALTVAVFQTMLGMLPAFLVGAMAVQIRADVDFPADLLGAAVMAFFLVSATFMALIGRTVDRLGVHRASVVGAALSTTALLGIANAPGGAAIAGLLLIGAPGNAVSQLAATVRVVEAARSGRQALALGIKQAAVPLSSVVAGVAVPAVGLTIGWRAAFAGASLLLIPVLVLGRHGRGARGEPLPRRRGGLATARRHLWSLSVAAGLGTAATNVLAVFYVDAVVQVGTPQSLAGLMLAGGSTLGALVRVIAGWSADRRQGRHLVVVAAMLGTSAVGYGLLAVATHGPVLFAVTALTFVTAWGWNGLLAFTVVRFNPEAPAQASGVTATGVSLGGAVGPAVAGVLAAGGSYTTVWLACAGAVSAGAVLVVVTRRQMIRDARTRRTTTNKR